MLKKTPEEKLIWKKDLIIELLAKELVQSENFMLQALKLLGESEGFREEGVRRQNSDGVYQKWVKKLKSDKPFTKQCFQLFVVRCCEKVSTSLATREGERVVMKKPLSKYPINPFWKYLPVDKVGTGTSKRLESK